MLATPRNTHTHCGATTPAAPCRLAPQGHAAIAALAAVLFLSSCARQSLDQEPLAAPEASPTENQAASVSSASERRPALAAAAHPAPAARTAAACPIRLIDVIDASGITFRHTDGSSGRHYNVESMSAGLATFDYDGDGRIDIYFPSGAALPGAKYDRPPRHALYRNLGAWRFEDVGERAGTACTGFGLGIAVADYDDDGWPDIYLNNFGPNVLYHNNGDGTFTDVTARAGVSGTTACGRLEKKVGAGACFLDTDGKGRLDLYAGNYLELDVAAHVPLFKDGIGVYPSPQSFVPGPSTLYWNNGDGTFADVSRKSGVAACAGRNMGMIAADYDNDGNTDLFVLNDVQPNFLLHNDGRGRFEEVAMVAGAALNFNGEMLANMGVDCADYDNDGRLDFYTTNYQAEFPMLLRNIGRGMFEDSTLAAGAGAGCYAYVKWGCAFADFDNDGRKDIFVANGHTEDNIELRDRTTGYRCHNVLLWNGGNGRFIDVSRECGLQSIAKRVGRGVAVDDLDNDGDLDVVVLNSRDRPTILRNMLKEQGGKNHWLQVRLRGVKTNRDGVGARVRVTAGELVQIDEVHSGRGYQSHWGSRLHFGLGKNDRVDCVEVYWIGGGVDVLEKISPDRVLTVSEGGK